MATCNEDACITLKAAHAPPSLYAYIAAVYLSQTQCPEQKRPGTLGMQPPQQQQNPVLEEHDTDPATAAVASAPALGLCMTGRTDGSTTTHSCTVSVSTRPHGHAALASCGSLAVRLAPDAIWSFCHLQDCHNDALSNGKSCFCDATYMLCAVTACP